jgi:hypothetical protein
VFYYIIIIIIICMNVIVINDLPVLHVSTCIGNFHVIVKHFELWLLIGYMMLLVV